MEKYDHYSLASRHTFGVEAYADYWIDYASPEDLAALIPILPSGMPVERLICYQRRRPHMPLIVFVSMSMTKT